jgi:hypothetical protein
MMTIAATTINNSITNNANTAVATAANALWLGSVMIRSGTQACRCEICSADSTVRIALVLKFFKPLAKAPQYFSGVNLRPLTDA